MRITSIFICSLLGASTLAYAADNKSNIYKKGWIDFNKNQKKDIYEDPSQPLEDRQVNYWLNSVGLSLTDRAIR